MRLLYASDRPPYPFFLGGAARCAHRLLLALAQDFGATVLAAGSAGYRITPWAWPPEADHAALGVRGLVPAPRAFERRAIDLGYPVCLLHDAPGALGALVDDFRPQVIWTQLEGAPRVLELARAKGIPAVLYVHDAEDDPAALRAMAALGCHVVCSSGFLARKVEPVIGRAAHVVYPASDWYFGTEGVAGGSVTMVNPHAVKGLDTFLEVARRMPHRRFLLLESWKLAEPALAALHERLARLPNVTFRHRVAEMREVYSRTAVLLVPSVWEEGFGMVAVEAQSCGIPVLASRRGGLPESVGDGGVLIDDYRNPEAWVAALAPLLDDPAAWRSASVRALEHASSAAFAPREQARRFLDVCAAPPPRTSRMQRGVNAISRGIARVPGLRRLVGGAAR